MVHIIVHNGLSVKEPFLDRGLSTATESAGAAGPLMLRSIEDGAADSMDDPCDRVAA